MLSTTSGRMYNSTTVEINRTKPVGAGLLNLGNTCFLNSVLQALSHCDFLISAIDSSHHSDECSDDGDCVLCAFERHIRIARSMTEPIAPQQIVQCLPTISSTLILGEQEDAHEFLRCMVDALQRSIPLETRNRTNEYPFSLFTGSVKNTVKCMKCKRVSTRIDPVEDLELEISNFRHLSTALGNFTSAEMLTGENKYNCENCRMKTDAQRSLVLHEIPPVLSIQLKRFSHGHNKGTKLRHFVEYPTVLDFTRFMSADGKLSSKNNKANLFAIVVHHGYSISNGHYVTYINTSHGWFKMDDATVKTCTEKEAMEQNAYLLFYQKNDFKLKKKTQLVRNMTNHRPHTRLISVQPTLELASMVETKTRSISDLFEDNDYSHEGVIENVSSEHDDVSVHLEKRGLKRKGLLKSMQIAGTSMVRTIVGNKNNPDDGEEKKRRGPGRAKTIKISVVPSSALVDVKKDTEANWLPLPKEQTELVPMPSYVFNWLKSCFNS